MKITIESTSQIVPLVQEDGSTVVARLWQGATESGIPVHALIIRIAPLVPQTDPRHGELTAEFERELERQADPEVPMPIVLII